MTPFTSYIDKNSCYMFHNSWKIHAPVELIWNELINYKKWPAWCEGLESIEPLDQYTNLREGNQIKSMWKGIFPYTITFNAEIRDFILYSFLSFNVTGDLSGKGTCHFLSCQDVTHIHFTWDVSTTKLWMRMSSPLIRPLFIENHNRIMDQGLTGFKKMIHAKSKDLEQGRIPMLKKFSDLKN